MACFVYTTLLHQPSSVVCQNSLHSRCTKGERCLGASDGVPYRTYLGESGRNGRTARTMAAKTIGIARGALHETEPVAKKNPRSTHCERASPILAATPSRTTRAPLCADGEDSDCQTGTVADMAPKPSPVTSRPTRSWASEKLEDSRTEPTMTKMAPIVMVRRRPNLSPSLKQLRAPIMHPTVYKLTVVPCMLGSAVFGNVFRNESSDRRPLT